MPSFANLERPSIFMFELQQRDATLSTRPKADWVFKGKPGLQVSYWAKGFLSGFSQTLSPLPFEVALWTERPGEEPKPFRDVSKRLGFDSQYSSGFELELCDFTQLEWGDDLTDEAGLSFFALLTCTALGGPDVPIESVLWTTERDEGTVLFKGGWRSGPATRS